jgi:PAS domain S-box-containing protein
VNSAFERLTHLKDVIGKKVTEVIPGIRESDPGLFDIYGRVASTAKPERFEMYVEALSTWFLISVYSPQKDHFIAIFDVITERKRAEQERESTIEFLRFVNENMDTRSLIRAVTTFLQRQSGCEAVGVRLREGEDYPYYEARGFSEEFVQTERSLCARDSADCVIRDKKGDPIIECMCGNVICGRFNPSKSFFTKHGSFWTNSTTELLRNTSDADRQTRTRNRCNGEGYESVALLPLRVGEQRLGLLQLNDRRKGIFTLEKIEHWERLADQLAIALAKFQTEEALRQSETRFSTVFRYSPIGIVLSRLNDGAFLDVNDSFLGVYGYAREELIGRTSLELNMWVSPSDREEMARILRDKGRVLNLEAKFRKKSGEIGDLLISAELVELAGEHCLLGLFSDISDRKRAERELRTAVDQWNNTFDAINDAIAILDENGTIQRCNNAMIKLVDKYPQHIIGQNYQDVIPTGDTCIPPDCPFDRIKNIRRRESATVRWYSRWYETTADPIIDQSGMFTGGVYVITDVTERRQFEERLSDSESKFRSLAEQSLVGIYIIQDSVFKYINPRFADLFGYPADEIIDHMRHTDLTWPADRHIIEKAASMQTSSELSSSHYEARGMKKSGDVIHTEIFGSRAYYQGRPAIIGVVLDITEKKKLEHQLLQAQKMEAVGQLTSGIAHDFNNILSAIIGYASLLQMKMEALDPRQPFVNQILASSDRAASLTRSLLTFSRKQIVNLMPMHLNESIKKVEMLLQRLIGEDIDLRTMLAPGDPIVNADAGQIEQVMMNLATNARDAMQKGGILAIETAIVNAEDTGVLKTGDAQQGYALITVTDTGIGMDERTREKIFEPFFTTKELGRGTGLGLSMVYGIIRQHDGFIHCYSEPRIGTTFKIYLPLLAEAQDNMQPKLSSPVSEELLGGTETILVVEDDKVLRNLSRTVLEDLGYTVIEAVDGVDAVEKFRENRQRISLVLCDVIMPRMSGEGAYEVIRRLSPDVKIVFMSGYPADIIRQKTLVDKEANIILKPVSPSILLRKVREVLDQ